MKPPQRRQAGMSLIEVLTALLIFSIGLVGLMGLQARAMRFSNSAEDTNRAALLASELASVMWEKGTVDLTEGDTTAWASRVSDPTSGGLPSGEGTVEVVEGVAFIKIVWTPPHASSTTDTNRFETQVVVPQVTP